MGVTTPCKGKIDRITVQLKETYPVGAVLGYVEASEEDAARFARRAPPPPQREVAEEIPARADEEVAPAPEKKIAARQLSAGERQGGARMVLLDTELRRCEGRRLASTRYRSLACHDGG